MLCAMLVALVLRRAEYHGIIISSKFYKSPFYRVFIMNGYGILYIPVGDE